jgi:hypothetical protein
MWTLGWTQELIANNFSKLEFAVRAKDSAANLNVKQVSFWDSWRRFCSYNEVELAVFVNGKEVCRKPFAPKKTLSNLSDYQILAKKFRLSYVNKWNNDWPSEKSMFDMNGIKDVRLDKFDRAEILLKDGRNIIIDKMVDLNLSETKTVLDWLEIKMGKRQL